MHNHQISVYGTQYLDSEPLYLTTEQGVCVFDRVKNRWLDWASLQTKVVEDGHTWQNREVGIPSIHWQLTHWSGQHYAPGYDDTSGLPSEAVVNGDVWAGAPEGSPANTAPDNWTVQNAESMFQNFGGILDIRGDAVLGGGMSQTLTLTPGEHYVVEVIWTLDQSEGVLIGIDGVFLPLSRVDAGSNSKMGAFCFEAPESGSVELSVRVEPGANSAIDHIRCFLESDLTGNSGTFSVAAGVRATLPETELYGPFTSGDVTYFIQTFPSTANEPKVYLAGDEDNKLGLMDVCKSSLADSVKLDIHKELAANHGSALPCMTVAGALRKKYSVAG